MIYLIKYSLLKKHIPIFSSIEIDLKKPVIVEIDNEKWFAEPIELVDEASVTGVELGSNQIIRQASEADEIHYDLQLRKCRYFNQQANRIISDLELKMSMLASEPLFDVHRIYFYFKAYEKTVNLRRLAKKLREVVKAQIDFQQIQGREIAKICKTIGPCEKETCCTRFLFQTPILKQEDVKDLWATTRMSIGACGRLKCCSNFEKEVCSCDSSCKEGECKCQN